MKRVLFQIVICLCAWVVMAGPVIAESSVTLEQGNELFNSGKFTEASDIYQTLIDQDGANASLLYNLGNSQYRAGDYGRAILSYERAKLLTPRDPDLHANLELARKAATIFDKGKYDPRLEAVIDYLSRDEWARWVIGAALWIGLISIGCGLVRVSRPGLRKVIAASVIVAGFIIIAGATALYLRRDETSRGVVLTKEASVYLSPFEKAAAVGVPGAGRIVQMGEKSGGFSYVSVPGTEMRGWMRGPEVARIIPEK